MLLSHSSSSSPFFTRSIEPRVFDAASTSRFYLYVKSGGGGVVRIRRSCLVLCTSKLRGMVKVLDEDVSSSRSAAAVVDSDQLEISPSRTFLDARTEQDLLLGIHKEAEARRLPINVAQGMEELYHNYRNAVFQGGHPEADEIVFSNMSIALDRIFMDVQDPFQFLPHHKAIREPFDYYLFGQQYIRPLIDFRSSFVGNLSLFEEMLQKLQQGENVILISNHQSEADPAVIALLLESTYPFLAENMVTLTCCLLSYHFGNALVFLGILSLPGVYHVVQIYVAGDRVVTDPLCKPFSMGRNLLCVYSKKHMNDDPDLIDMKKRANAKSLKEMALLLRGGSKIIWIAPSGGRDRPDPVSEEFYPAPFDASSVDNMRRLVEHAGIPGHLYPLAMLCYDIMPPPAQVEKEIGERRVISFHGVGLSVAPKVSYQEIAAAFQDPEEAKMAYAHSLYSSVNEQYNVLRSAIHGKQGLKASTPSISLSQPQFSSIFLKN